MGIPPLLKVEHHHLRWRMGRNRGANDVRPDDAHGARGANLGPRLKKLRPRGAIRTPIKIKDHRIPADLPGQLRSLATNPNRFPDVS
jgi:hypothetical protein